MMHSLILLSLLFGGLPLEADWWASRPPAEARAVWLERVTSHPKEARAGLVPLLEARELDSSSRAGLVWNVLRSSTEFRRSFAAVLAVPVQDGLDVLLADRSSVDLLYTVAVDRTAALKARTLALELLGRAGGRREAEHLLAILLDPKENVALRAAAGKGLLSSAPLLTEDYEKLAKVLDRKNPDGVQIMIMHLVSLHPDPTVVHRLSLLARSRRSGKIQEEALRAFVTACERAYRDESTLAAARRGLEEIGSSTATPLENAAQLLARNRLAPELFEAEMRDKMTNAASWWHYFSVPTALPFWLDAVFEYGALHGQREIQVVDQIIALLAEESDDSPAHLTKVLFALTERRPGWLVDGLLRKLEQGDADIRLAAAKRLGAVPDPYEKRWNLLQDAGARLSWFWDQRIPSDVLTSLLVRALRRDDEAKRLVDRVMTTISDQPELEDALQNARLSRLRFRVFESVLQGGRRSALFKVADHGSQAQRVRALEKLVALREGRAASALVELRPERVLAALFGGPLNRVPPDVEPLTELGVRWLAGESEPPVGALKALFRNAAFSSEEWTSFWEQLGTVETMTDEAKAEVEKRLHAVCLASESFAVRAAWQILTTSSNAELAQAARRRLARSH